MLTSRFSFTRLLAQMFVTLALVVGLVAAPGSPAQAKPDPGSGPTPVPSKDFCGGSGASKAVPEHWGKANFKPSCRLHDSCYSHESHTSRKDCDLTLLRSLRLYCDLAYAKGARRSLCHAVAGDYYIGVRVGAKKHYHGHGSNA